jgi:hypothetical protein
MSRKKIKKTEDKMEIDDEGLKIQRIIAAASEQNARYGRSFAAR